MATSAALVGSTGLVGSNILSTLLGSSTPMGTARISTVHAFSRKTLPAADPASKLRPHTSSDPESWAADYSALASSTTTSAPASSSSAPAIFYSALGTTRAAAGSFAAQRKIDYDLNLALARAAASAGTPVYVLISSAGSSATSIAPYSRMKGELEAAVSKIEFARQVVILRPGLILGSRSELRTAEYVLQLIAGGLKSISRRWLTDWWAQDASVIARAAVRAGVLASEGKGPEGKVWMVSQSEIVRLGQAEWKE